GPRRRLRCRPEEALGLCPGAVIESRRGHLARRIGVVAVLAAALFASAGAARADTPPNVFSGVGLFVDNPQDFPDAETVAGWLQDAHFTWVAMHIDDVGTLDWTDP